MLRQYTQEEQELRSKKWEKEIFTEAELKIYYQLNETNRKQMLYKREYELEQRDQPIFKQNKKIYEQNQIINNLLDLNQKQLERINSLEKTNLELTNKINFQLQNKLNTTSNNKVSKFKIKR